MKKENTWIRPLIVIVTVSTLSVLVVLNKTDMEMKQLVLKNQKLQNECDSLRDELFIEKVDVGRHELTREDILSKYPNVKKEYEKYYEHQTE
jgi:hypothetical protein